MLEPLDEAALQVVPSFEFTGRMFVSGRGLEYATAREIALKLMETCGIAAGSLTTTALSHGPVAAVNPLFPVWLILSRDPALPSARAAAEAIRAAGGTLLTSGEAADEVDAAFRLKTPAPVSPLMAPLLSVVPGQLFACALAQAKGLDPDRPLHLNKITLAQ
jgi:glucosamine--fructose-6-phosphate aminotransferase (isomerizing)